MIPLSLYLFSLAIEVLAAHVLNDKTIKGITIEGKETKLRICSEALTAFLRDKTLFEQTTRKFSENFRTENQ